MLLDNNLLLSSLQAITGDAASTNVIDLTVAEDIGIGEGVALKLLCQVGTALSSTNSATLTFQLQASTDNSTWSTIVESAAIAAATLIAGYRALEIDIPRIGSDKRYLRMYYDVGTGVFSAGTITSTIVLDRSDTVNYPSGYTVTN